ncbi:MAG: hypothetical protein E6J60_05845 [Deltaproteobacteria bacterium]|nr:MAG: hypothetical protein E6J60_05845 [Deltaproteobacteria bacterium]
MTRRFEDVEEGDELPTRELFLAKDQVRAYARAANQWSPRFTDEEGARREGLPGMITPACSAAWGRPSAASSSRGAPSVCAGP